MSDSGGDDAGEFEDFGEAAAPDLDLEPLGLDEDAAGTDDEEDDSDAEFEAVAGAAPAAGPRVDPIVRMSNRSHAVIVVPPDDRVTDNRLHQSEASFVISARAEEIAKHATHFAERAAGLHDPVAIAYQELIEHRCPLVLTRRVGSGPNGEPIVEEWPVREMVLPPLVMPGLK